MKTFLSMCAARKSKGDVKGKKNRRAFMTLLYVVAFAAQGYKQSYSDRLPMN
jgi:hypothetical protein